MKKSLQIGILSMLLLLIPIISLAAPIDLMVGNKYLELKVPPVSDNGRTLVPVRPIFEALGAEVEWDNGTKTVTGIHNGTTIKLVINNNKAEINGEEVNLDVPAKIIKGNTMVPTRFVAESLGAKVEWDKDSRTVLINSDKKNIKKQVKKANYNNSEIFTSKDLISDIDYFSAASLKNTYGKPKSTKKYFDDYKGDVERLNYDFGYIEHWDVTYGNYSKKFPYEIVLNKNINALSNNFLRNIKIGDNKTDVINKFPNILNKKDYDTNRKNGIQLYAIKQKGSVVNENKYMRKIFDNPRINVNGDLASYVGKKWDNGIEFTVGEPDSGLLYYKTTINFTGNKVSSITIYKGL